MQVLAPFPLTICPAGQRGRRSVVVQYEIQSVVKQKHTVRLQGELFGNGIDLMFHVESGFNRSKIKNGAAVPAPFSVNRQVLGRLSFGRLFPQRDQRGFEIGIRQELVRSKLLVGYVVRFGLLQEYRFRIVG